MSAEKYTAPRATIGMSVIWFHDLARSKTPDGGCCAFVTKEGEEGIGVVLFPPDQRQGNPKSGCRHVSDPALAKLLQFDGGVWDYTEETKRLMAVEAILADLVADLVAPPQKKSAA